MINMEKKSHGKRKECNYCHEIFPVNKFNFNIKKDTRFLKSLNCNKTYVWYCNTCKKCSLIKANKAKHEYRIKLNKIKQLEFQDRRTDFIQHFYDIAYFGSKKEPYFNGDFGEQEHLDKLMNLKLEDLSENELKFYEDYKNKN